MKVWGEQSWKRVGPRKDVVKMVGKREVDREVKKNGSRQSEKTSNLKCRTADEAPMSLPTFHDLRNLNPSPLT